MGWPGDRDACANTPTVPPNVTTCNAQQSQAFSHSLFPGSPPPKITLDQSSFSLRKNLGGEASMQANLIVRGRCGGACYYDNWVDGIFSTGGGVCGRGSSHH